MAQTTNPYVVLPSTAARLDEWKSRLYDLTRRNRLLYFRVTKSSVLQIADPDADALFEMLVNRGRSLRLSIPESAATAEQELWQEETGSTEPGERQPRTRCSLLRTRHEAPDLRRILNNLSRRAKIAQEEQGIHVLYACFGMLRWRETPNSDLSRAPLLLVPVQLVREAPGLPYHLAMAEEDITSNPTLREYLRQSFGMSIPDWMSFTDDEPEPTAMTWHRWLDTVSGEIQTQPGWSIEPAGVSVSILSYLRQIIVDDLDTNREMVGTHPIIHSMANPASAGRFGDIEVPEANELDEKVPIESVYQILDADSSQQRAIEAAKRGHSLVLQGPPGTGKSQTIANIIAESLAMGKRVLFVSAKMAALEVVQRRLQDAGLDRYCLQVHSHRRSKLDVIRELDDALENGHAVSPHPDDRILRELAAVRKKLNDYPVELHRKRFEIDMSAFEAFGTLARLRGVADMRFSSPDPASISRDAESEPEEWVRNMAALAKNIGDPSKHPWAGCQIAEDSLDVREGVRDDLADLDRLLSETLASAEEMAAAWGIATPATPGRAQSLAQLAMHYHAGLLDLPLDDLLDRYNGSYTSFWRRLSSVYRADKAAIQSVSSGGLRRRAEIAIELEKAVELVRWVERTGTANAHQPTQSQARELLDVLKSLSEAIAGFARHFHAEWDLTGRSPGTSTWPQLADAIAGYQKALPELGDWIRYHEVLARGPKVGLPTFVSEAIELGIPPSGWLDAYRKRFARLFLGKVARAVPPLKEFHSAIHTERIGRFRDLDRVQLQLNPLRIQARVVENYPRDGADNISGSEASILRREARKKRRVMSLRRLFQRIPNLIPSLKPCLMMSPLTVSQLLDPAIYQFDLLIFDEASQLRPEECVCAIARAKQVVVAGDEKQLPPTSFFESIDPGDDYDEDSDQYHLHNLDSILSELETFLPGYPLKWHYRSRDEALIAFSNKCFYDGQLYTFPAPGSTDGRKAIDFVHVADGIYSRGSSAAHNQREAQRVVDLVIQHAEQHPSKSLGVVTFSQPQREAVLDLLDEARRGRTDLDSFFSEERPEPTFVKNLETVQGDERDVMLFSVGYGRDDTGRFTMNFGPLNRQDGERRLNVAVTRARERVLVVASIQPEEFDLRNTSSRGVHLLCEYLRLARDGVGAIVSVNPNGGGESPFEEAVYSALTKRGLELVQQVGVAKYRIDMAVVDSEQPGRYILGIECDGAMYHSAATARERDRLRQEVLEGLGWTLHRIWSRDWYENPEREIERVLKAVNDARKRKPEVPKPPPRPPTVRGGTPKPKPPPEPEPEPVPPFPTEAKPYTTAEITFQPGKRLANINRTDIVSRIERTIKVEGPVHVDVLMRRMVDAAADSRLGSNGRAMLHTMLDWGNRQARWRLDVDGFAWPIGQRGIIARYPNGEDSARRIEHICDQELAEAAWLLVRDALSLEQNQAVQATARFFGKNATTAVAERLQRILEDLLHEGRLERMADGRLRANQP